MHKSVRIRFNDVSKAFQGPIRNLVWSNRPACDATHTEAGVKHFSKRSDDENHCSRGTKHDQVSPLITIFQKIRAVLCFGFVNLAPLPWSLSFLDGVFAGNHVQQVHWYFSETRRCAVSNWGLSSYKHGNPAPGQARSTPVLVLPKGFARGQLDCLSPRLGPLAARVSHRSLHARVTAHRSLTIGSPRKKASQKSLACKALDRILAFHLPIRRCPGIRCHVREEGCLVV